MTEVDLKPGAGPEVAALFDATNPDLVRDQPDWLGAEMLLDAEALQVVVIAHWRDLAAYRAMAETPVFRDTMQRFAADFAGPARTLRPILGVTDDGYLAERAYITPNDTSSSRLRAVLSWKSPQFGGGKQPCKTV